MTRASMMRALRTFIIAFLALWVPLMLGFLQELTQWAAGSGQDPFPDLSNLKYGLVSAVTAALIGLINFVWVAVEDKWGKGMLREVGK